MLLIIPAYNEESSLPFLIDKLNEGFDQYDFLIVNDNSTDNTIQIIQNKDVRYLDLPINLGIGGAVQTGYIYALRNGYDIAVQVDGDGQHNPEYIKDMIAMIKDGADMVIGSRFITKEGFQSSRMRRLGIHYLSFIIKLLTGVRVTDPTSGFRACNRKVIRLFSSNYPIDYPEPETIITVLKNRCSIKETAVVMNERMGGKSSIDFFKSIYYMIKVSLAIFIASASTKRRGRRFAG